MDGRTHRQSPASLVIFTTQSSLYRLRGHKLAAACGHLLMSCPDTAFIPRRLLPSSGPQLGAAWSRQGRAVCPFTWGASSEWEWGNESSGKQKVPEKMGWGTRCRLEARSQNPGGGGSIPCSTKCPPRWAVCAGVGTYLSELLGAQAAALATRFKIPLPTVGPLTPFRARQSQTQTAPNFDSFVTTASARLNQAVQTEAIYRCVEDTDTGTMTHTHSRSTLGQTRQR